MKPNRLHQARHRGSRKVRDKLRRLELWPAGLRLDALARSPLGGAASTSSEVPPPSAPPFTPVADVPALRLPLAVCRLRAGFPSPAEDYVEAGLALNELLVRRPAATFFLRVEGDSRTGAGIHDGDLLVVDRAAEPCDGSVVVACVDGRMTVKRLRHGLGGELRLEAEHPGYPTLTFRPPDDDCDDAGVSVWGSLLRWSFFAR